MHYSEMERYWIWLSSVEGIGPKRLRQLMDAYENPRALWDELGGVMLSPNLQALGSACLNSLLRSRSEDYIDALLEKLERMHIRAVTQISEGYPALLSEIYDPPGTLYVRGNCPLDGARMFSIVGSRLCTQDGRHTACAFGQALAQAGVTVVSGFARGIDTHAHEGALKGGGRTIAVLGCGVDICYPPENADLRDRLLDAGGAIISEYLPGTRPLSGHFPARNRIISGMSVGTLLVEGAKGSGAMITINDALDQNRDVFAVPGSIHAPQSAMPNQLIRDGACPALSAWDILEHYRWGDRNAAARPAKAAIPLTDDELAVVNPLRLQALSFEELVQITGFSAAKLNSHLTTLELRGIIERAPGSIYRAYE